MSEKKELECLLQNIQKGLKVSSAKELNQAITAFLSTKNSKREVIEFVMNTVCEDYHITPKVLIYSTRRGTVQQARQIVYCLLHLDLDMSTYHIAKKIFFKWPNSVRSAIEFYKGINQDAPKTKQEREFKQKYECYQQKIITFLSSNNQNFKNN